jgi:uncharacterized protein
MGYGSRALKRPAVHTSLEVSVAELIISAQTYRRYVLGQEGLWPGRRWVGREGVREALSQITAVQMDPVQVVAHSHDLVLWSRVADYNPDYLEDLMYRERVYFDYGGSLFIYPAHELPYRRVMMRRAGAEPRWAEFAAANPDLLGRVRREIMVRGPLSNRDFEGGARVKSYRASKETGLALYYLWLTGDLVTHHRRGTERVYELRENLTPPLPGKVASEEEAVGHFTQKALRTSRLRHAREWANLLGGIESRKVLQTEVRQRLKGWVEEGLLATARVEGLRDLYYLPAADLAVLGMLEMGGVPEGWEPVGETSEREANFLSPLDAVSARGRARDVFGFSYIWEIYKPASARRYGPYTLPILWGDKLVARIDPSFSRKSGTLMINGLWLEDDTLTENGAFTLALGKALERFAQFLGSVSVDLEKVGQPGLRRALQNMRDISVRSRSDE